MGARPGEAVVEEPSVPVPDGALTVRLSVEVRVMVLLVPGMEPVPPGAVPIEVGGMMVRVGASVTVSVSVSVSVAVVGTGRMVILAVSDSTSLETSAGGAGYMINVSISIWLSSGNIALITARTHLGALSKSNGREGDDRDEGETHFDCCCCERLESRRIVVNEYGDSNERKYRVVYSDGLCEESRTRYHTQARRGILKARGRRKKKHSSRGIRNPLYPPSAEGNSHVRVGSITLATIAFPLGGGGPLRFDLFRM